MGNATTYRCPGGDRPDTGSAARGRLRGLRLGVAALALTFAGPLVGADAFAQSKKAAKAESAQPDQATAQRAYAAGTKSFESGDMTGAEQQLSAALAGGGLPNAQMARALYLRGSAYRRLGRPAQAISDLTTAVWLKGGLSEADKAKATEERQLAYREAGLGDTPPPIGGAPLDQSTKAAAAPTPPSGAQVVHVTEQSFWNNFSMPSLTGSSQPAPVPAASAQTQGQEISSFWSFLPGVGGSSQPAPSGQPAATGLSAAPAVGFAGDAGGAAGSPQGTGTVMLAEAAPVSPTTSWETQTASAPAAQSTVSAGYAAQPAPNTGLSPMGGAGEPAPAASGNPLAGSGTAVSNFFGNMFGSSSADASSATGSTGPAWNPDTTVVTAQTSSMVQRGPDSPPAQTSEALPWAGGSGAAQPAPAPVKVATAASAAGKYKLQVAAVRSREEAERLVQTLSSYPPVREGRVSPEIDESVIGSMGTFYRVRLGPYANASEPSQLCTTLKPQGFDCLVVTQ
ncbi:SPOR domain-containing protein [Hyphomicrobium sp. CS1GBMeth3]|uniref:SPOR domain-containing protein n=1 Tax=Hyphomicrobium sp. CS1GBMeth3 TaxID=1892845 RepID=UPI0009F9E79C|nr:SPOR domain-containing protein [Hyphomicrobium sp. CS1GBMeth3]